MRTPARTPPDPEQTYQDSPASHHSVVQSMLRHSMRFATSQGCAMLRLVHEVIDQHASDSTKEHAEADGKEGKASL